MKTPQLWKHLKRHPLSSEYEDITGPEWMAFTLSLKKNGIINKRKIILFDEMVLDGWQLLRGCIEVGIEPEFETLPKGIDPDDYVDVVNDQRRQQESQVTKNRRAEARRWRVANRRQEGASTRTIAEEENVSRSTIGKDLEKLAEQGVQLEPPDGKVTGKDGKKQPAAKPKILCPSCQHRQSKGAPLIEKCEACAELRKPKPPTYDEDDMPPPDFDDEEKKPKAGKPRSDDAKFDKLYLPMTQFVDARARGTGKGPTPPTRNLVISGNCHGICQQLLLEFIETYKLWKKRT